MSVTEQRFFEELAYKLYGEKRLRKMFSRFWDCYINGGRVQVKRWDRRLQKCLKACGWDCVGRPVGDRVNLMIRPASPYDSQQSELYA